MLMDLGFAMSRATVGALVYNVSKDKHYPFRLVCFPLRSLHLYKQQAEYFKSTKMNRKLGELLCF